MRPKSYPRYNPNVQTGEIRLNRFISQSGLCSRREADDYIQAGLVSVNGVIVTELGSKVKPTDEVKFNDSRIEGEKKVYLVLNKPKGYVTSLEDPHADKTVMDLVKGACEERIYPVGRLDKNSLGLLLFTNDGDMTRTARSTPTRSPTSRRTRARSASRSTRGATASCGASSSRWVTRCANSTASTTPALRRRISNAAHGAS